MTPVRRSIFIRKHQAHPIHEQDPQTMPLQVTFSDKNNKYQYDGHAHALPEEQNGAKKGRVFLGDRDAGSMVQIKHRKIKQAVNCQSDQHGLSKEDVKYLNIDPVENGASCLELAYRFICASVEKKQNVLVFCDTGCGRSAAIAIYYLMKNGNGMSLADAHRAVESVRAGVQCNDPKAGFRKELLEKLIVEEKKLRKKVTMAVDGRRNISYLDGKDDKYRGPLRAPGGGGGRGQSASPQNKSPWTGLVVFGAFIAVLYGLLLMATGGK